MTQTSMREHAVALASMGFRVFKLGVWGRIPAVENWPETATSDVDQVRRMWTCPVNGEGLANNIGILTGTEAGDLMVLDVDRKNGARGDESLQRLIDIIGLDLDTYTVRTPTGGRHIYLRTKPGEEVRNSVSSRALGGGLDVRGWHGFVVGPGSETWQGRYEIERDAPIAMAPEWLVELCGRHVRRCPGAHAAALVALDAQADLERAVKYLEDEAPQAIMGAGGDHATFKVAARLGDMGVSESMALGLMLEHWNERKAFPPWEVAPLEVKVGNAYQYRRDRLGVASPLIEFDVVELEHPDPLGAKPAKGKLVFDFVDEAQVGIGNPYLIKGWLDAGTISILYGDSTVGKSFVALDIGWHIGAGCAWNGCKVRQGLVIHLTTEGGAGMSKRLVALRQRHGVGSHLAAVRYPVDLRPGTKDVGLLTEAIRDVEKQRGVALAMIVVDTFSRATAGLDENSASDMNSVMRIVQELCDALRCHVMLVHHTGKTFARGARGSSALRAAVDTELEVTDGLLTATKQRDIEANAKMAFVREKLKVGHDEEGEALSSSVIRWKSAAEIEFEPVEVPLQVKQLVRHFKTLAEAKMADEMCQIKDAKFRWKEVAEFVKDNWTGNIRRKESAIVRNSQKGVRNSERNSQNTLSDARLRVLRNSAQQLGLIGKDEQDQWFVVERNSAQ